MTSNSSNRVYVGTINPGGSLSNSGGGPIRARPYTTPAAPGRSSFGSSNNALTVLSSHPTSSRNVASSHDDEDMVVIEDEVSCASSVRSSSFSSSRKSSMSSETVSSVSVNSPVRQSPSMPKESTRDTPPNSPHNSNNTTTSNMPPTLRISPQVSPPEGGKKTRPIIEASKVKKSSGVSTSSPTSAIVGRSSESGKVRGGEVDTGEKPKEASGKSKEARSKSKGPLESSPKVRESKKSAASPISSSSGTKPFPSSSEARKRPATASAAMAKPKCVSLGRKELIGKGSFGMVYKALDLDTNRLLAVKEIPLEGPNLDQLPTVRREIVLMERLSHPNIVQCMGHDIDDQYLRIYMEYVAGGCVSSLLKNFGSFQERQASIVTKQVLLGLQYLHDRKIAHRDLKGDNILLQPDGTVKLADFGTARELATTAMSLAGTAYFMAPEMIKGTGHGLEADIWSVGCCIIEMLTGKPPFSHLVNQYAIMTHIAESQGPFDDAFPRNASAPVLKILRQCLVKDPSKRATCRQLLEEPWIKDPPVNAEMKGPLILEMNTVSEVRDRVQKKPPSSTAKNNSNINTNMTTASVAPRSIRGVGASKASVTKSGDSQPLSSFNPMVDDD